MATKKAAKSKSPLAVGNKVFIRAVTNYYTGKIISIDKDEVVLENAAWIADTGRFHDALKNGTFNEVEPFIGLVCVGRGAICDVTLWTHDLPAVQK